MKAKTKHVSDDVLAFGKYKGERVIEICQEDPLWIDWALHNVSGFTLTPEQSNVHARWYKIERDRMAY